MERTRTGGNPSIKCRAFHNNELDYSGYSIAGSDWPQVLLKLGDDIKVVLNSHQINGCQDVIDLELLLDREMKQHLCWY